MNPISAILLIISAPCILRRRHPWRGYRIDHLGRLWPHITIGWWTWDPLPEQIGQRVAEIVDKLRDPHPQQPTFL